MCCRETEYIKLPELISCGTHPESPLDADCLGVLRKLLPLSHTRIHTCTCLDAPKLHESTGSSTRDVFLITKLLPDSRLVTTKFYSQAELCEAKVAVRYRTLRHPGSGTSLGLAETEPAIKVRKGEASLHPNSAPLRPVTSCVSKSMLLPKAGAQPDP